MFCQHAAIMEPVLVYITAQDKQEAEKLARALLEARLAACANILTGVTSLYWWQGAVQESAECVVVAKSVKSRVQSIIDKVKSMHSYSCPCVVALPIQAGYHEFLDWIVQETTA